MGMRAAASLELNVNFIHRTCGHLEITCPVVSKEPGVAVIPYAAGTVLYKQLQAALKMGTFLAYGEHSDHIITMVWKFLLIWDAAFGEYQHKCWQEFETAATDEESYHVTMRLGTKKAQETFELVFC